MSQQEDDAPPPPVAQRKRGRVDSDDDDDAPPPIAVARAAKLEVATSTTDLVGGLCAAPTSDKKAPTPAKEDSQVEQKTVGAVGVVDSSAAAPAKDESGPVPIGLAPPPPPPAAAITQSDEGKETSPATPKSPPATPTKQPSAGGSKAPSSAGPSPVSASKTTAAAATPAVDLPANLGNGRWQFKTDLRKKDNNDKAWADYSTAESKLIEKSYATAVNRQHNAKGKGKKPLGEVILSGGVYGVHFDDLVQFRKDDRQKQRPVRRLA